MISTQCDVRPAVRALTAIGRQVDFAIAGALNDTAFEFRDTERRGLSERMTIRRQFVLQGIQVPRGKLARRDNLLAEVELEPKRDFLAKFEQGGIKSPRSGRHLAVPDEARPSPEQLIPKRLRPRNLQVADGPAQQIGFRRDGRIRRGRIRQARQGLYRTFLVEGVGIFQRVGRGGGSSIRMLYSFTERAQIPPDLRFVETAQEVARRSFAGHFARRFADAIRTARV